MPKPTSKVTKAGKLAQRSVEHSSCKAYQFDFYVPKNIWKIPVVKKFFDAISTLGGATVFDDEIGIWKGEKETTQVFRLVVRESDLAITNVRETLRCEIDRMMVALLKTKHAQEAMMYTETEIQQFMAKMTAR